MTINNKISPIIDLSYYTNYSLINNTTIEHLVHPKTLVYVIQYKSAKSNEEKTSILLGRDMNNANVTGYNIKKSALFEYLSKYWRKIINKNGFVMPCLWYIAKNDYKDAKVVYII